MQKKNMYTTILAIIGTVLVWIPISAPIFFSVVSILGDGRFRFDYLMPAEFFPLVFAGGILLVWVAMRAHTYQKLIGWSLGIAIGLLLGGQVLAVVTGLASGETEPVGIWWALILLIIFAYSLCVTALGVGGVLIIRNLFRPTFRH